MKKNKQNLEFVLHQVNRIILHKQNVLDNCVLLSRKLIETGKIDLGLKLLSNGYAHDNSKFFGLEFQYLHSDENKTNLKHAIMQHESTNSHHPEYWDNIHDMPEVFLAEFCCDIKARSEEFGTDLRKWIDEFAAKKWKFTKDDEVYAKIMKFVDLLCEKPFGNMN